MVWGRGSGAILARDRFERLDGRLQQEPRIHTKDRPWERRLIEAVSWIGRSGAQWRCLPAACGRWESVAKRFARWGELGVWKRLFRAAADEPDLQSVMVDAKVVRAHACPASAPSDLAKAQVGCGAGDHQSRITIGG